MARNPKGPPPEYRFKPGVSGNPGGRKKSSVDSAQIKAAIGKFMTMTKEDVVALIQDPKTTIVDLTIASIFMNAVKTGDSSRFEHLLQRAIGKVKEQVEIAKAEPYIIQRLDGSQIELGTEIKELEE